LQYSLNEEQELKRNTLEVKDGLAKSGPLPGVGEGVFVGAGAYAQTLGGNAET